MTEPIQFRPAGPDGVLAQDNHREEDAAGPHAPSNSVHARVGDLVLHAARSGLRRGLRPEDIIREIMATYHVHLSLGELRLLLASRSRGNRGAEGTAPVPVSSPRTVPGED